VGFVVKTDMLLYIKKFETCNERLCWLQIECKWINVSLINCYAPAEEKENIIKEEFYSQLDMIYDNIPRRIQKIILGDFNAKVGREDVFRPTIGRENLHEESNDNGVRLVTLATSKEMVISSTCYSHKNIHKQTWTSPGGTTHNQIDHVVVDNQIKHWIQDVRSCREVGSHSDHFLVRAIIRVKLPRE